MTPRQAAISYALEKDSANEVVEGVKRAVIDEMKALDDSLDVKPTEYFNHTFVPDLVVWWRDAGQQHKRELFLRFDISAETVALDVERLHEGGPIFFGLRSHSDGGLPEATRRALGQRRDCLLTESPAIERLEAPQEAGTLSAVLGSSVVRGGRGILDDADAVELRSLSDAGFTALLEHHDDGSVSAALTAVQDALKADYALRVERYMQMVWLSTGGALEAFPGRKTLEGRLAGKELRQLLLWLFAEGELVDDAFWTALGEHLTIEQLGDLERHAPRPNLRRLINANLDRLVASKAGVRRRTAQLNPEQPFDWVIEQGMLALAAKDFDICFSSDRRRYNGWPADGQGPLWSELRSKVLGLRVEEVTMEVPARQVDIQATGEPDLTAAPDFEPLAESIGDEAKVRRVKFELPTGGPSVDCDFQRRIADAGDTPTDLSRFAFHSADVLLRLDETQEAALKEFFGLSSDSEQDAAPHA